MAPVDDRHGSTRARWIIGIGLGLLVIALVVWRGLGSGSQPARKSPVAREAVPAGAVAPAEGTPAHRAARPAPTMAPDTNAEDDGDISDEEKALRDEGSAGYGTAGEPPEPPPPGDDSMVLRRDPDQPREATPAFKLARTEQMIGHQQDRLKRTRERLTRALQEGDADRIQRYQGMVKRLEVRIKTLQTTLETLQQAAPASEGDPMRAAPDGHGHDH